MNNLRRLVGSTVQSALQSDPTPAPEVAESPPWVEKATGWAPQIPRSSASASSIDSTLKGAIEPRRDSSSSGTVGPTREDTAPLFSTPGASTSAARSVPISSRLSRPRQSPPSSPSRQGVPGSPSSSSSYDPATAPLRSRSAGQSRPPPIARKPLNQSKAYSTPSRSPRSAYGSRADHVNTRDELLMMLLSSQAVMDSREFEILTSEEVDELKTVRIAKSHRYSSRF